MGVSAVRERVVNELDLKFKTLSLDKRYEYLESLELPSFVVQSVDIDNESRSAASSVFDYVSFNTPEYLEKLPGFTVPSRE